MNQRSLVFLLSLVLLAYMAWLVYLGLVLPAERADVLFSETGWFEDLSAVLWLVLAAVLLIAKPIGLSRRLGMAVVAAALAAREEGWHKRFTTDSLFKSDYYQMTNVPMVEKLIAGAVAVGLTITLAGAGWARGIRSRWLASSVGMAGAVCGGDLAASQGG
ncbi:hypothetical protein ABGV17_06360 [Guyparkeria sp. GHLCS8-2]|uniref:hypothetical protein n=1 Tax=Guyparkeria halopsychrophila TaxID=3139421 RepID=UPI0037CC1B18